MLMRPRARVASESPFRRMVSSTLHESPVRIAAGSATLDGDLVLPEGAVGIVLFAHGSGSSRTSPRNRHVARQLNDAGLATLLMDLLTPAEEADDDRTRQWRFDIGLLAARMIAVTDWVGEQAPTRHLPVGSFGASTGAAATSAAGRPDVTRAVVSRGGRPDLAEDALADVRAPTLLIVGGADTEVIELNRRALLALPGDKRMTLVPNAGHLFEEPGALDKVAALARDWFVEHLRP